MTPEARIAAAAGILDKINQGNAVEKSLTNWARKSRFAGSGDRAGIRDLVFDAIRRQRSFGWLGGAGSGRGLMAGRLLAAGVDPAESFTGDGYALPALSASEIEAFRTIDDALETVQLDCPEWVWPQLKDSLGEMAAPVMRVLQDRAPVFLRANISKTTTVEAIKSLAAEAIVAQGCRLSPTAIKIVKNPRRVQNSRAFLEGMVEFQDVASQAVIDQIAAVSGESILDYCAGGGGKSLALAALGCRVKAYDLKLERMNDIPVRAKRAGVQIEILKKPKGVFETVLCDVPCSGSGAWRRQPEAKWQLSQARLNELNLIQDQILNQAQSHVSENGKIAYVTCSLLKSENQNRVERFLSENRNWRLIKDKQFTPLDGGDGFFVAILRRF